MDSQLKTFFRLIFNENEEGYLCIATRSAVGGLWKERFFLWPVEFDGLIEYIYQAREQGDVWYCPQLFDDKARRKDYVKYTPTVWSDLDSCLYSTTKLVPTVSIESSPGRYQALWRIEEGADPIAAEDAARRLAYFYSEQGADKSGWDLTQLLRVPTTFNSKYAALGSSVGPEIKVVQATGKLYKLSDFDFPEVEVSNPEPIEYPGDTNLPDAKALIANLDGRLALMVSESPSEYDDWSAKLWELETSLFELGLSPTEVFSITLEAGCNKYRRDGRANRYLWREICRAWKYVETSTPTIAKTVYSDILSPLLSNDEREHFANTPTFVEDYIKWAKTTGDAAWQYHQGGAFVLLSSVLASKIVLRTSFGTIKPNLWFMLLADTTLTRKTSSMDLAMDLLDEVDPDAVLGTDGSIEGLFSALEGRKGQSSIFLRDEFSGLLDSMVKKDYMAGMMEMFTKLYDGKLQKRVLRKETVVVRDPCLIMYTGGIKSRTYQLLTSEHVTSGFLPRFIFLTATADIRRIKPVGPPTNISTGERTEIIQFLQRLQDHYDIQEVITVANKKVETAPKTWEAEMTPQAWKLYNLYEYQMTEAAFESIHREHFTPAFDRLSKSGLKCALLIAACRMEESITITEDDIKRAFYYVEQWRTHTVEVMQNIGKTMFEKLLDSVMKSIEQKPGIYRADVMRKFSLKARDCDELLTTLDQRGMILRKRASKQEELFAKVINEDETETEKDTEEDARTENA